MELSTREGNPAHGLKQVYQELMALNDPSILHKRTLELVTTYEGQGISRLHMSRFKMEINGIKDDVTRMKFLISNFILKADGFGVTKIR